MGTEFDRIFKEEQRRQRIVVGLIATLLFAAGFAPRNERAIFTQSGASAPLARAFAAIAPDAAVQRAAGAPGGRIFQGAQRPVLDAVVPPVANAGPVGTAPIAPAAPGDSIAGQPGGGVPAGGSNSANTVASGPESSFASLPGASPGGFAGNAPGDPGTPGGNPGGGPGDGGGTGPGDGNPVAPVPEAPIWLMLIFGLVGGKVAQQVRQRRLRSVRIASA